MSSMSSRSGCVQVHQALDVAEVDRVRAAVLAYVAEDSARARRGVVLDLSHCDFVDVVGHRMLVDVTRTAERRGLTLHLVGVGPAVVRVITLLDAVLSEDVGAHIATHAAQIAVTRTTSAGSVTS